MKDLEIIVRNVAQICELNEKLNYKEVLASVLDGFEIPMKEFSVRIGHDDDYCEGLCISAKGKRLFIVPAYPAENSEWKPIAIGNCLELNSFEDEYPFKHCLEAQWKHGNWAKWYFKTSAQRQRVADVINEINRIIHKNN